jgi:hypothetical protein
MLAVIYNHLSGPGFLFARPLPSSVAFSLEKDHAEKLGWLMDL